MACNWQVPGPYSHLKKPAIEQVSFKECLCKSIVLSFAKIVATNYPF